MHMNMPEHAEIYVNLPKSAWIAFVLFPHCNPLSTWMRGYLFQALWKTRSYCLIEQGCFLQKTKNEFFYGSWKNLICFLFWTKYFYKILIKFTIYKLVHFGCFILWCNFFILIWSLTVSKEKINLQMTEYPSTVLVKLFLYLFHNCYDHMLVWLKYFRSFLETDHFLTSYGWTLECQYSSLMKLFSTTV